jgi:hypothetical protein
VESLALLLHGVSTVAGTLAGAPGMVVSSISLVPPVVEGTTDSSVGRIPGVVSSTAPVLVVLRGTADFPVGGLVDEDMVVSSTVRVPVVLMGSENSSVAGVVDVDMVITPTSLAHSSISNVREHCRFLFGRNSR